MKYLLIFTIAFTSSSLGQSISVRDAIDGKAIAYAHLLYTGNNVVLGGTYTNHAGHAIIDMPAGADSITISCLNYVTQKIDAKSIPEKISLERAVTILNQIDVLSTNTPILKRLGYNMDSKSEYSTFFSGYLIVTLISNPYQQEKKINSFNFYIKKRYTSKTAIYRIIFFKNENNLPGEQINLNVLLDMSGERSKNVSVNLDSLNLMLPVEGLFVGLELIGFLSDTLPTDSNGKDESKITFALNKRNFYCDKHSMFLRNRFSHNSWVDVNYNSAETKEILYPAFNILVEE